MAVRTDSACRLVCEAGDWRVTNLQLQKILYLAQMHYLGAEGERLSDTFFEAWDYGPVAPGVYRQVRMFGAGPVRDVFKNAKPLRAGSKRLAVLDAVCRDLLRRSPGDLVAITHWRGGAWAKTYQPGVRGVVIRDDDIAAEYRDRVRAGSVEVDRTAV